MTSFSALTARGLVATGALLAALVQAQPAPPPPSSSGGPVSPPAPTAQPAAPAAPAPLPQPPQPPLPPGEVGKLYPLASFDRILVDGVAKLILVQGEREQAYVWGSPEMLRALDVDVADQQLTIRPSGTWRFWNVPRINIKVEVRQLRQVTLAGAADLHAPGPVQAEQLKLSISGAGSVRFDQLQAQQLQFDVSGAGDGHLAGQVGELNVRVSGKGRVTADQLKAQQARINISGIGNATLWVTDKLAATISGIGGVDYYGQPKEVQRHVSGMGSISSKGEKR
jgi:hypothetical protein